MEDRRVRANGVDIFLAPAEASSRSSARPARLSHAEVGMTAWADYLREHKRSKPSNAACEECERPFFVWPTDKARGRGRFCSNTCKGKFARTQRDMRGDKNPRWKGGISKFTRYSLRFRKKYPEKNAAHRAVQQALGTGHLTRQPCEHCGSTEDIHAHHANYSKPLEVMWLCRPCHVAEHRK